MTRDPYTKRTLLLASEMVKETAKLLIDNAPLDPLKPIQVTIGEATKQRKPDQNSLMWVGPLADIAEQAWVEGKRFSAEVWHHHFKVLLLPEEYDERLCKEGYCKWSYGPTGDRILTGSTTHLTVYGFSLYMEALYAEGGNMGVMFRAAA